MESTPKIYLALAAADTVRAMRGALHGRGYRVQEAMDWTLIPEEVGLFGASLVIVGHDVPGLDVTSLIESLRADGRTADRPILFAAPSAASATSTMALAAGADDLLQLPVVEAELLHRVRLHLDRTGDGSEIDVDIDDEEDKSVPPAERVLAGLGAGLPDGYGGGDTHYDADMSAVIEVSEALASSMASADALYVVVRRIAQIIPLRRCNVVLKGVKRDEAFVLASHDDANLKERAIDLGRYPEIRRCLESGEPVLIEDVRKDPEMERVLDFISAVDLRSAMVLPLYVREGVVGTLGLTSSREMHGFTRRELLFVRAMANLAAGVLATSDLVERVRVEAAAEKPPMEDISEVVLDLDDQIEGLIEDLERK